MGNALRFKHTDVLRQPGEMARFKVIQGPDFGSVYVVIGTQASIGRGEDNDIVISDLKASRNHADLVGTDAGWTVKDRKSSNGIIHNGQPTREALIQLGDTLALGETTLEFITADAGTSILVAPAKTIEQVQKAQKKRDQVQGFQNIPIPEVQMTAPTSGGAGGLLKNPRVLLWGGVGLFVAFMMLSGEDKPVTSKKKVPSAEEAKRDLASYLVKAESNKTADSVFKDGMREYFSGNYNRARTQFETVLQIVPAHELASLYLENCTKAIKDEVKTHLAVAKRSFEAGKLKDSRAHFERVMQYLYKDQSNPSYIEAKDQLEKVIKVMAEGSN